MEIEKLILFHSVARLKSFTKAAEECHIAQAAISRSIASLEDELGFKLFDRTSRNVSLTAAGKSFFEDTTSITNELYSSILRAKNINTKYTDYLSIGFSSYEVPIIQQHVTEFLKEYPKTNIEIFHFPPQDLSAQLISKSCDIVYGPSNRLLDMNNARYVQVGRSEVGFLTAAEGVFKDLTSITPKQLSGLTFFMPFHRTVSLSGDFQKMCAIFGFTPGKVIATNSPEAMYSSVAMGLGYSIIPANMDKYLRKDLRIIPIDSERKFYKYQIAVCLKNISGISAKTSKKYIDFIESNFSVEFP